MSDHPGPSVDPTNPHATLRATADLIRNGDFATADRLLGWALDFNPEHAGLLRRLSDVRWDEGKPEEARQWAQQALAVDPADAESYAHIGLLCMREGRYTEAAELLARAIEIKPDNPGYLRRFADILVHLGRGEDAVDLAERAAALRPEDVYGQHFLASLQQRYGDFEGAEASILKAVDVAPKSAIAQRRMAEFQFMRGDLATARVWAARAREASSEDPGNYDFEARLAAAANDLAAAEAALVTAASLGTATAHNKRRLSDALMRRGDWDGAFIWAERAVADHPQDLHSHHHLANLRMAGGKHDDACAVLAKAAAQAQKPADATSLLRRLSQMTQQKGAYADALGWAERAMVANPFDAENHAQIAELYMQQDKLAEAHVAAARAAELAPGNPAHLRRLSSIAWRTGEGGKAIDWATKAIAIHPTDAQNYAHQATILMRQGQNEAAEAPLSRAVELAPLDAGLLTRLSDLKMLLGKQDEAFSLVGRAIAGRPYDPSGYNHLATLHLRIGDLVAADAVLNRAQEAVDQSNVPLLRRLADVALRRGEEVEAISWLQLAVEVDPRDPLTYNQLASLELARGNSAAAEEALTQATAFAGNNPAFHRRLSDILNRRGDERGALYWAERIVQDFPTDPAGFLQLGTLHLSASRLDEAEAAFLQAHGLAGTPSQAIGPLHRLSDVATRRNDVGAALNWAAKAIETAPREAAAYNHLAGIHLSYGNLPDAAAVARTAIDLAPTDVSLLRRLSEIELRRGQTEIALNLARRAVVANRGDPHGHNLEASVLLAVGDTAAALACVERALKLAPADTNFIRRAAYLQTLLQAPT
jgi:tetratricopeptide (TPR) repeat protein